MSLTSSVPSLGAVGLPQLLAVVGVGGAEEQGGADRGHRLRSAVVALVARVDVLDQRRAELRCRRRPRARDRGCRRRLRRRACHPTAVSDAGVGPAGARPDVLDQHRAIRAAVGRPQLLAVDAVTRGEEQRVCRPWSASPGSLAYSPARMSLTKTVPARVPSDFQSSRPWTSSSAAKYKVLPTAVSELGSL